MYSDLIKYYFIFLITIYLSMKLLNQKAKTFTLNVFVFIFTLVLAVIAYILALVFPSFSHLIPLLLLWIFMSIYASRPQIAFIIVIISFGISYCIHAFSSFVSTFVVYFWAQGEENFSFLAVAMLATIFHTLIFLALLQTKRLRKGLPLSQSTSYLNIATILCLLFISLPIYLPSRIDPLWQQTLFLIVLIFTLAFLIFWWQAQITKSYRRSLELRELESIRTADLEKDILIQKLLKDNDRLATITHRDNTLITTLVNSTCDYLMQEKVDWIADQEKRMSMVANVRTLQAERTSLPENYNEKHARDFDTGLSLLDDMLHQMDSNAIKTNIAFSVHMGVMLDDFVPKAISEMDLVHVVDDLLKNAFKATRDSEHRVVQLQFYKLGKHFVVEVADSGVPFEVESLVKMGLEKRTTYADGSGIGLVDIWKTKENCGATYHIDEYDTPNPFTKKISLTFDGKNRYSIRTSRKEAILQMSKRADLQVYGYEE